MGSNTTNRNGEVFYLAVRRISTSICWRVALQLFRTIVSLERITLKNRVKNKSWFSIVFLTLFQSVMAQKPSFRHYDVDNGLPSSECYWIIQDSRNAVWIASDAGVAKYDGYTFTTYTRANGLPDNTVFKIHEDHYGKVWFSTLSGQMAYYDYRTDSIYGILANAELKALNVNFPIDFCFDSNDTLWVSLQSTGLVKVEPPYYKKCDLYQTGENLMFVHEENNSAFIYGQEVPMPMTNFRNSKQYTADYRFYNVSGINHLYALKTDITHFLFSDGTDIIQAGPEGKKKVNLYPLRSDKAITNIYKDSKNRIWLSTLSDGLLGFVPPDFLNPVKKILHGEMVTCIYEDNEHGFWVTTLNNGLYYLPDLEAEYYSMEDGLSSDKTGSIALFNKKVYIVTSDRKLNVLDPLTGKISVKADQEYYQVESNAQFLKINTPNSTFYDGLSNRIIPVKQEGSGQAVQINQFTEFDTNHLMGFNTSFLYLISKRNGAAKKWGRVPARILCLKSTDTCILVGTRYGLYMIKDNKLVDLRTKNPVLSERIESIAQFDKRIYIAVKGIGLLEWAEKNKMKLWDTKKEFFSNFIKLLYSDSSNRLWIGTNRGISVIKRETGGHVVMDHVNHSRGLISNEINDILVYNGKLYSATNRGLSRINVSAFMSDKTRYPVYIEALYINGQKRYPDSSLTLGHDQNFIDIHYKSIQAANNGNILYKYRLLGLDSAWKYTRQIQAHFTTLPPGKYSFEVYALNPRNVPSVTPAILSFSIEAPFWRKWWFTGLSIFVACALIYSVYRRNVSQLLKRAQIKAQYEKLLIGSELKLLRMQMNPHFIFNAINSIQSFILKNQALEANKYLSKFAKLMRKVLEYSKYEAIPLQQDIEILQLYTELEALRSGFCFDVVFNISENLNTEAIKVPPMIIQPFVENAILHGILNLTDRRGKLQISFSKDATNRLTCVIDDNGVGLKRAGEIGKVRHKHQKEHSFGIEAAVNRLEALNFRDTIKNEVVIREKIEQGMSLGTQVTVIIDLK